MWHNVITLLPLFIFIHFKRNSSCDVLHIFCAGSGMAGMRQADLIKWYVEQQNEKNNYSSEEEAHAEVNKLKAIIEVELTINY